MKRYILFILAFTVLLFSCEKDVDENVLEQWNMNKIEGPTTGTVEQPVILTVFYPTSSGCDHLTKFETNKQGSIISIKAFGYTNKTSFCTMAAVEKTKTYEFTAEKKESLELKFINKDNTVIKHLIKIE